MVLSTPPGAAAMPEVPPSVLSNPSMEDNIKLKVLIQNSGKTQAQIADEIGIDRTYMSQMATGKVSWINSGYFSALAKALDMTDEQIKAVKPSAIIESNARSLKPTEIIMFASNPPDEESAIDSFRFYAQESAGQYHHGQLIVEKIDENKISVSGNINDAPHIVTTQYAPELLRDFAGDRYKEEWQNANSLPPKKNLRPLPPELEQMIDEKSVLDSDLLTERWQQYLAGQRFSTGRATPERWWNLFLLLKNAGVEPGGN